MKCSDIRMPFAAPIFSENWADIYATVTEAMFLAVYYRQTDFRKHIESWNKWIAANKDEISFTAGEQSEWDSLMARSRAVERPQLKQLAVDIANFWESYQ